jgi:SET domain-containing protein
MMTAQKAKGIFKHATRLNHSCAPNCYVSSNHKLEELCVYALQDIKQGEELTIAYNSDEVIFQDRQTKMQLLEDRYGFECTCPACEDTELGRRNELQRQPSLD